MTEPPPVLGSVVFWTVPPGDYLTAQIRALFDRHKLDPALKPNAESRANAFRRLRTEFDGYRYTVKGKSCVVRCRDEGREKEKRKFFLERHLLAGNGSVVGIHDVGWAKFYYPDPRKKNSAPSYMNVVLDPDFFQPGEEALLEELKSRLEAGYDRLCKQMDQAKLRTLLRSYMHVLDGVQLSDSMFFVPTSQAEHLDRVHQLTTALGCRMRRMQVTGGLETVQVVAEGATADLSQQLGWVVDEIDRTYAKRTKGVTVTSYLYIRSRFERTMMTAAVYREMLGSPLDAVGDAALAALESLDRMEKDAR